jgi:hypothetical protein
LKTLDAVLLALNGVPAGLWNFFAALIAFSGVMLTIHVQGKRLGTQLAHDRGLRDRDREMLMRKDIYLGAAEAFAAGVHSLARYGDPSLRSEEVVKDFESKRPSLAKVYVVASSSTIRTVAEVVGAIVAAQLKLSAMRITLLAIQEKIEIADELIRSSLKDRAYLLDAVRQEHTVSPNDPQQAARLESNVDFYGKQVDDLVEKRNGYRRELRTFQAGMMVEWQRENAVVNRLLIPAVVSLRTELELPIDESNLRSVVEHTAATSTSALAVFIESVAPATKT